MHSKQKQEPDQTTPLLSSINPTKNQVKCIQLKAVTFILVGKFCEFFSFIGLKAILILYLVQVLLFEENTATVIFHGCFMISSFSPLFGAYLADVLLGRFKTITFTFVLYIIGSILICMASVPEILPMRPLSIFGIVVTNLAHGSAVPCYSAFGGDQFKPSQTKELGKYFSMLFISMKLSKVASMFLSPVLRADVHCFGQSTCFPLAFGVFTIFIILSLIILLIGYPYYKIYPASGNIIFDVIKCIVHAVTEKFKTRKMQLKKNHWLDYADDKYDTQMISDIKTLFSVSTMFVTIPIYWALFEQQGSKWTLQATRLNNLIAGYEVKPDQMQVTNAILGIILVYIFNYVFYPLLSKCNLLTRLLQRMTVGGIFFSFAFVAAGFLQLSIEKNFAFSHVESNSYFDNTNINRTLMPLSAELPLSDMKSKQDMQLHAMNCSLNEVPNRYLEIRKNQIVKCLHNNGTIFYIQRNKFINWTQYETNRGFSLHNNSFPIGRENMEVIYKFPRISHKNGSLELPQHALESSTTLSILLQIPQYFLLTFGEIMFTISSTQFAYSQAPMTMKTIITALLLINTGIGNIIVMAITGMNLFQRQSYEFFFYAILQAIAMLIFAMLAHKYKYRNQDGKKSEN